MSSSRHVPSHLYSFSFAPNPDWSETYSPQPEIRDYLRRLARERDLYRSIRLGTTVTAADWDDDAGRWTLRTSGGPVNTGCASGYIDASGRNATLWPDWTWRFRRRSRRFDPARHTLRGTAAERVPVAA